MMLAGDAVKVAVGAGITVIVVEAVTSGPPALLHVSEYVYVPVVDGFTGDGFGVCPAPAPCHQVFDGSEEHTPDVVLHARLTVSPSVLVVADGVTVTVGRVATVTVAEAVAVNPVAELVHVIEYVVVVVAGDTDFEPVMAVLAGQFAGDAVEHDVVFAEFQASVTADPG